MVKLLSPPIVLDSLYLYDLPRRAIYHYVSRIARVHDPLSKENNPGCGECFIRVFTVISIDASSAQIIVDDNVLILLHTEMTTVRTVLVTPAGHSTVGT